MMDHFQETKHHKSDQTRGKYFTLCHFLRKLFIWHDSRLNFLKFSGILSATILFDFRKIPLAL
jgi:ABC-type uncharacterized transport system involved in gliding motility auxiliary subunit